MKEIMLGIRDYLKDIWHDWLVYELYKIYRKPMYIDESNGNLDLVPVFEWKEGSLKHYIKQRQRSRK